MAQKLMRVSLILYLLMLFGACSVSEDKAETSVNPNGDSELALLMRNMYDDAERMKKDLGEGKRLTSSIEFENILTATATEPEKARSPQFKAYADAYIKLMHDLGSARPAEQAALYKNIVNTCMNCHYELCPGPTRKIRKLY